MNGREWLETNGIGGYASSTITGMNTRRYHGLLVAATKPPVGRMVLLSKLEETLIVDGRRIELSSNQYPGVVYPQGHERLKEFRQGPFPTFVYDVDGLQVEKCVFMVDGENTTVVEYRVNRACTLEIRPLIAFRDYHATAHENSAIRGSFDASPGSVAISPYDGCPTLHLAHTPADIQATGEWYRNFEYAVEQERGLDFREDLFNPLLLTFDFSQAGRAAIVAGTEPRTADSVDRLRGGEMRRRERVLAAAPGKDPFVRALVRAADQFIVRRGRGSTVIAGYHWFSDWGRDTMIALPGVTLATGRYDDARGILLAFAESVDRGMLPNRFPDAGETPEYNTVDATLWFFEAARAYAAQTGDTDFVRDRLLDVFAEIISWHERGTRFGIRMGDDGLLLAGEPGVQLTWMDAKVGDWVVTPRHGKPVEIQALWYNALCAMAEWTGSPRYRELAARARASFKRLFWNQSEQCLYDVVASETRDPAIRPNQIFAVSLHYPILTGARARSVVDTVERHLLTPYGLRTLAPSDPAYRGRFEGGPASRDGAYHQGTVWPWLLGPFLSAYRRVNGAAVPRLNELRRFLAEEGLGQLPEVFDGDAPHRPGGCVAQAWSVAELLRSVVEEAPAALPKAAACA